MRARLHWTKCACTSIISVHRTDIHATVGPGPVGRDKRSRHQTTELCLYQHNLCTLHRYMTQWTRVQQVVIHQVCTRQQYQAFIGGTNPPKNLIDPPFPSTTHQTAHNQTGSTWARGMIRSFKDWFSLPIDIAKGNRIFLFRSGPFDYIPHDF